MFRTISTYLQQLTQQDCHEEGCIEPQVIEHAQVPLCAMILLMGIHYHPRELSTC